MPAAVFARSPTAKPCQGVLRPLKNFLAFQVERIVLPRNLARQEVNGSTSSRGINVDVVRWQAQPMAVPHGREGRFDSPCEERRVEQWGLGSVAAKAATQGCEPLW